MSSKPLKPKSEKTNTKKRLVLFDAHAILHRAYHALPDFSTQKGEPTGALYGLAAMLMKIIGELKPDYLSACYDLPKPTYRHEAYENYKLGRAKAEEDLVAQIKRSGDIFRAFGIPIYEKEGFEADDILGTIVEKTKEDKNLEIIIASGDMDTLQLVSGKKVRVYTLKKGIKDTIIYDEDAVRERYGFSPELLPDYKGLSGDPSDNIVGITGVGEKTATALITKFGSIEDIYKKLKKSSGEFLKAGIKERVLSLLKEGEEEALFSKMLAKIRRDAPIEFSLPEKLWRESLDASAAEALFDELEFRSLSRRFRELFGGGGGETEKGAEKIDQGELKETAVALWLANSNFTNPDLDDILNFAKTKDFKAAGEKIFKTLKERGLEKIYEDMEKPLIPVVQKMTERGIAVDLEKLKKLSEEFHKELSALEKEIWSAAGGEFNINSPKQLGEVLFDKLGFSAKGQRKTAGGARSTKESELEKLRGLHPIIGRILEYRELQKLLSTYIDNLPEMVGEDGRLHASFSQAGTTTGRMSSQNPNLQNIPIRGERGKRIREAFVAGRGWKLVAFDYSQIELRIAAFLSGDEKLLSVFKSGGDIHTAAASEVFGVPEKDVDAEMRRKAKIINFGILYGMGVNALRANLGTSREDAQRFLNEYFSRFRGLSSYIERVKKEAGKKGYTSTYFGRRRYFEGISSNIPYIKAAAERMAVNAPIQGTQADIVKLAMVRIDGLLEKKSWKDDVHLLLQVHDELVYEIKEGLVKEAAPLIREIMENIVPPEETGGLKFVSEEAHGDNWGEI